MVYNSIRKKEREDKKMKKTYYFDVDGVLADFHNPYRELNNRFASCTYEFIRNLKPFTNNINLVKNLVADGNRVYISTMVANENTKKARLEWLAENLPEIPQYRIITIVGHGNKAKNRKTKVGILVDDKKENCRQWEKEGLQAVWVEEKGGNINL